MKRSVSGIMIMAMLPWSGWWLVESFSRLRFERVCNLICPAFIDPGLAAELRQAGNWCEALSLALVPLLVIFVLRVVGVAKGRFAVRDV